MQCRRLCALGSVAVVLSVISAEPHGSLTEALGRRASAQPPSRVSALAIGERHICSLNNRGGVRCLGTGEFGQLGNGRFENSEVAVDVIGLESGVRAISAGLEHTCALLESGQVKCWGRHLRGSSWQYRPVAINF